MEYIAGEVWNWSSYFDHFLVGLTKTEHVPSSVLLQLSCFRCVQLCATRGLQPARLLCAWASLGKNPGVGCHAFLQGTFPTQGSNPSLPPCRQILYCLSHRWSPRTLQWVAYHFSRGSSPHRNRTRVSCITGGFCISWATREAHTYSMTQYLFS